MSFELFEKKADIEAHLPEAIASYKKGKKMIGVIVASILVHAASTGDASMLATVTAVLTKRDNTHLGKFLDAFTPVKVAEGKVTCKGWNKAGVWNEDTIQSNFMDWEAGKTDPKLRKATKVVESMESAIEKYFDSEGADLDYRMAIMMLEDVTRKLKAKVAVDGEVIPTNTSDGEAATPVH